MMLATEDWTLGWEFHRPSTRLSSSDMLIVTVPAALPAGTPPRDFWAVLQETGAGFADLGKRWRRAAFRAYSACKTAQKSRVVFAPPAL